MAQELLEFLVQQIVDFRTHEIELEDENLKPNNKETQESSNNNNQKVEEKGSIQKTAFPFDKIIAASNAVLEFETKRKKSNNLNQYIGEE